MIAKLTGVLESISGDSAVLDVGGVGYKVFCAGRTLGALPRPGEMASLLIETHVREDHIHLFGFIAAAERDWFNLLLTVQGVGAKVALAVLTVQSPDELGLAIAARDATALTRASGVGRKVAERIVGELKDKAGDLVLGSGKSGVMPAMSKPDGGISADAVSALVNLGYRRLEALGAVGHAMKQLGSDADTETLIKAGLRELAS